jgi:hypothetical protein
MTPRLARAPHGTFYGKRWHGKSFDRLEKSAGARKGADRLTSLRETRRPRRQISKGKAEAEFINRRSGEDGRA